MPASLLREMSSQSGALEEQRALQIALELSKLGVNENEHNNETTNSGVDLLRSSRPTGLDNSAAMKKSANMTECVPVPSSEHVAEIVGRQGCKIKALRARTNTYIKTPVRGEEPVFVVTGRREDVACAKREILSAAEHFSQIRASRRNNNPVSGPPGPPSPTIPGQVTIQVRVPYRVVGLVVGPKGATIKRIQQHTHTYIVTPSRDKEPIFEVTGLPSNVDKARQEIESHIAMRTGGLLDASLSGMSGSLQALNNVSPPLEDNNNDFHSNGIDSEYTDSNGDLKLLGSVYKPPSTNSAFTSYKINRAYTSTSNLSHVQPCTQDNVIFNFPPGNGTISNSKEYTSMNGIPSPPVNGFGVYDSDEGIGSPPFDPTPLPNANILWCDLVDGSGIPMFTPVTSTVSLPRSSSSSTAPCGASPPLTDAGGSSDHAAIRRIRSDPLSGGLAAMTAFAPLPNLNNKPTSSASASGSTSSSASPTGSTGSLNRRRACYLCTESDVVAALVPCGHNLFCMECAGVILAKPEAQRRCPVCKQVPTQAIRIFS